MIWRQLENLFQRSKSTTHLLQLHSLIIKTALNYDHYFTSKFILSSSSISIKFARLIFDTSPITPPLFAWNIIIREHSKSSIPIESVKLFSQLQRYGLKPDKFTYPFVLKACGLCSVVRFGGTVHSMILKMGFDSDRYIRNTILRMYWACGSIGLARKVFDEMSERDVVSWSCMIAGYINCNSPLEALTVFREMKLVNEKPNSVTLVSLLSACTGLLNVTLGKSIHSYIIINHIEMDVALGTALLEMYGKCGYIDESFKIFDSMREKNLQTWTVMISCLADHGRGKEANSVFTQMEQTGLRPDSMAFSAILVGFSHLGLVDEGRKYFDRMVRIYNLKPTMEHYGCMVDMFGRAGMIEEAYQIIRNMPMKPNSIILRSFMSAYRNHGCVICLDENLRKLLLEIEPNIGANYVLVASVSSISGYWDDVDEVRGTMKERGLKKVPGCSWVEVNGSFAEDVIEEAVR